MEEKKKKNTGLKVLVVILTVLLIGAIGYICYDKGLFDKFVKNNEPKQETKVEEKLSEEEVMKLHDSTLTLSKRSGFYYERKVSIEEIPSDLMLEYAITNYLDENNIKFSLDELDKISVCGDEESVYFCNTYDESDEPKEISNDITKKLTISKEAINSYIKEKFNTDRIFTYTKQLTIHTKNNYFYAQYNSENKEFYLYTPHKGTDSVELNSKYIKFNQKNDEIIIYSKPVVCSSGMVGGECGKYQMIDYSSNQRSKITLFYTQGDGKSYDSNNKQLSKDKKYIEYSRTQNKIIFDFDLIHKDFDSELITFKTIFKKANDGKYYWYSTEPINE